jgi:hypothetical protein
MKQWSDDGTFDLGENRPTQRMTLARRIYDCIGSALAQTIQQATR